MLLVEVLVRGAEFFIGYAPFELFHEGEPWLAESVDGDTLVLGFVVNFIFGALYLGDCDRFLFCLVDFFRLIDRSNCYYFLFGFVSSGVVLFNWF